MDKFASLINRSFIFTAAALVVVIYSAIGVLFVPDVPYRHYDEVVYPLLVIYKSPFAFMVIFFVLVVLAGFTAFKLRSFWLVGMALVSCGLFTFANWNILRVDYSHHDSTRRDGQVYHLGTSKGGGDPHMLTYMVYRCDSQGIICKLVGLPHSGIDPGDFPGGKASDRTASFDLSEDDMLHILVGDERHCVTIIEPAAVCQDNS